MTTSDDDHDMNKARAEQQLKHPPSTAAANKIKKNDDDKKNENENENDETKMTNVVELLSNNNKNHINTKEAKLQHHGRPNAVAEVERDDNKNNVPNEFSSSHAPEFLLLAAPPFVDNNNNDDDEEEKQEVDVERTLQQQHLQRCAKTAMATTDISDINNISITRPGAVAVFPPPLIATSVFVAHNDDEDDLLIRTIPATMPVELPNSTVDTAVSAVDAHVVPENEQQLLAEYTRLVQQQQQQQQEPAVEIIAKAEPINSTTTTNRKRFWKTTIGGVLTAVVAIVVVVVVAVVVSKSKKSSSSSPTISRLEILRTLLLNQSVSSVGDLDNTSSPQYQALEWLAIDQDGAKVNVTNITELSRRYILATLYYATDGNNWINQYNFLTSSGICNWTNINGDGVMCNQSLLSLRLASNNLVGTIPTELGKLTMLSYLDLTINNVVGTIPTELGKLTMLNYLALSVNKLVGTIPSELGKLTMLSYLDLSDSNLVGTIPTELGKLTMLSSLGLRNNTLSGTVPTVLAALPQLVNLFVDHNNITGNLTHYFCDQSQFQNFYSFEADCNSTKVICSCCTACF